MVRPSVQHKKEASIALYMVSVREHCSLSPEMEKELKDAIKSVGGSINQSGLFLSTTSTATTVTKQSGVNRRSVAFIPRDQVGIDLLEALDAGTSLGSAMITCIDEFYYSMQWSKFNRRPPRLFISDIRL